MRAPLAFSLLFFLEMIACLAEKPVIQDLVVPDRLFEGKKLFLACYLNSGKRPVFTWYHSDEPVKPSDNVVIVNSDESSQLVIKEMRLADSGPYVCKVENAHGSDSRRVDLKLNGRF